MIRSSRTEDNSFVSGRVRMRLLSSGRPWDQCGSKPHVGDGKAGRCGPAAARRSFTDGGPLQRSQRGSGGSQSGSDVPLDPKKDQVLQNAVVDLINDGACISTVGSHIQGFSISAFQTYLGHGATFYDGTTSTTPAASLYPSYAARGFSVRNPGVTSVASWFAGNSSLNAVTSIVASSFTTYIRPGTIKMSNSGVNARNRKPHVS